MKKVNERNFQKWKVFAISWAALFISYSVFFRFLFTSDHVKGYLLGGHATAPTHFWRYFVGGRFTAFFFTCINYVMNLLNVNFHDNHYVYVILMFILLAFCCVMLYELFCPFVEQKNHGWLLALLLLSFINPYVGELFVYVGWEICVGILLMVLGVDAFVKNHYIITFFFVFFGIGTYQSLFSVFMIYSATWLYLSYVHGTEMKPGILITKVSGMIGITGVAAGLAIVLNKLAAAAATGNIANAATVTTVSENKTVTFDTSLFFRIKKLFWKYVYTNVTEMGLLPKGFLVGTIIILGIVTIVLLKKRTNKKFAILFYMMLLAFINVCPVSVYFVTPYYDVFARIVWPAFATLAMTAMIPLTFMDGINIHVEQIYKVVLCCILGVCIHYTSSAEIDFFISNSLDMQIAYQVEAEIEHYEAETGITVTTIGAKRRENVRESYPQTDTGYYNYAHKSTYDAWSDVELITFLMGREYQEIDVSEEKYEELFGDQLWDTFVASEQLVFEGDTLYWAVY